MPIEIREIVIKTEILVNDQYHRDRVKEKETNILKRQLLAECRKIIAEAVRKPGGYKR